MRESIVSSISSDRSIQESYHHLKNLLLKQTSTFVPDVPADEAHPLTKLIKEFEIEIFEQAGLASPSTNHKTVR